MLKDIIENNENVIINKEKVDILKKYFPSCFNSEGCFDVKKLEQILNQNGVDITKEGYELNFLGKSYAKLLTALESETIIMPDLEHNSKPENKGSENIYITGDNLDAVKHLLKSYAGEVKCIYIDPPYNIGSDGFVYKDNFTFTAEQLSEKVGISEEEAQRILSMTSRGSSSHSAWLTFIYPRLYIARDLLRDDGVVFISIDDNEQANLKLVCDEIFGEENFVTSLAWQSRQSIQNDTDISVSHEYILVYAKRRRQENRRLKESNKGVWYNHDSFACSPLPLDVSKFSNPDNDPRGLWKADPFDAPNERENLSYEIINPNTGEKFLPPDGRHWRTEQENYKGLLEDNRIVFGVSGEAKPQLKVFYEEKKAFGTVENTWFDGERIGTATKATKELQSLFNGASYFDTPKPTTLIGKLIYLSGAKNNDIVLDFFSGSATTAEAVLRHNAENDEKLKFILVQLPESFDEQLQKSDNNKKKKIKKIIDFLDKINKPHLLSEIGIERIKRAAEKIKKESKSDIDYGFKIYELVSPQGQTLDKMIDFDPNGLVENTSILEELGSESILTTWKVQDGYGFSAHIEELCLDGYTAYKCKNTLYFINPSITTEAIKNLIEKYQNDSSFFPNRIVILGYSFGFIHLSQLKDNLKQLTNYNKKIDIITRY